MIIQSVYFLYKLRPNNPPWIQSTTSFLLCRHNNISMLPLLWPHGLKYNKLILVSVAKDSSYFLWFEWLLMIFIYYFIFFFRMIEWHIVASTMCEDCVNRHHSPMGPTISSNWKRMVELEVGTELTIDKTCMCWNMAHVWREVRSMAINVVTHWVGNKGRPWWFGRWRGQRVAHFYGTQ